MYLITAVIKICGSSSGQYRSRNGDIDNGGFFVGEIIMAVETEAVVTKIKSVIRSAQSPALSTDICFSKRLTQSIWNVFNVSGFVVTQADLQAVAFLVAMTTVGQWILCEVYISPQIFSCYSAAINV